ncbi:hypothetical protein Leryth_007093 [Lithospermum erythrorhizon]|nr:hypothetical protein Leryth_007093 [Lithospermum erythrorhizon]
MSSVSPELSPPTTTVNTTAPPPPEGGGGGMPTPGRTPLVALGVGIGIGGLLMLFFVCIFIIWYRRKKKHNYGGGGLPCTVQHDPKGDPFTGLPHRWQQNVPSPTENGIVQSKLMSRNDIVSCSPFSADVHDPPPPPSFGSSLNSEKPFSQESSGSCLALPTSTFTYEELALATGHFASANLLGQGGFGYVHKGVLLNGREVAIKQLKLGSCQGEREFQAEVDTISRVDHRHLVTLVGYCVSGAQRLLVYEYVPNKTLEFHLHSKGQPTMNWATRIKIARGSAKGLAYLHDECRPKVIHRDIKSANILIDEDFEAKVADFGLARFYADTDTHVSTRVMGTFGYLAPEYALTGKLTDRSDVFSFGVVLLELITGRRPVDKTEHYLDDNIVDWARPLLLQALDDNNFDGIADPRLQKNYDTLEMTQMVSCASVCVRHLARRRPKMGQILQALQGKISLDALNHIVKSGESTAYGSHESLDYDNSQYKEELKQFRKMAFETLGNTSSELSEPTSNFGVVPSASSSGGLGVTLEIPIRSEDEPRNTDDSQTLVIE